MDKFDRDRQRSLLEMLYELKPSGISDESYQSLLSNYESENILVANIKYLEGHGLVTCEIHEGRTREGSTFYIDPESVRITSKGVDFIRNDGGLGAILNVVNVRLHNDTITKLESIIVSASDATEEEKSTLISVLRKLPEDAIKHLNLKLLDVGVSQLPHVFHAIQTALHSL